MQHHHDHTVNPAMPILTIVLAACSWLPTLLNISGISALAVQVLPIIQVVAGLLACVAAVLTILSLYNKRKDGSN